MMNITDNTHVTSIIIGDNLNSINDINGVEFLNKHLANDSFRKILNSTNEGLWFVDNEGIIKFANKQIAQSLGYMVNDILGKKWTYFIPKEDLNDAINHWKERYNHKSKCSDIRLKARDGSDRWFIINSTSIDSSIGLPIGYLSMFTDITDRKKMEENINLQKLLFQTVIENIPDSFIIFDEVGNIVLMNNASRQSISNLGEVKSIYDIYKNVKYYTLDGRSISYNSLPGVLALKGFYSRDEVLVVKRNNKEKIVTINTYPIESKDPPIKLFVTHYRDVTNQIRNQQLVQLQQDRILEIEKEKVEALNREMQAKDEFLTIISHEFKTPIAVISSAVQAMKVICKDELSEKSLKFLDMILQNSARQLKLVNNLLDYSRVNYDCENLSLRNVDIVKLTSEVIESIRVYADQKYINLIFKSTLKEKIISLDQEKYERILMNLLSNAVKFSQAGKSITVRLSIRRVNRKNMICLQVRDEGIGIPEDKLDIIFEKFGQVDSSLSRQAEGSGIGLPLVKRYIELMGGFISLDSRVGKGSIFTVLLPTKKSKDIIIDDEEDSNKRDRLKYLSDIEFSDVYL